VECCRRENRLFRSITWDKSSIKTAVGAGKIPEEDDVFLAYALARRKNAGEPGVKPGSNPAQWQAWDLAGSGPITIPTGFKAESARARRCRLSILARSTSPMIAETYQALQDVIRDGRGPEVSQDPGRNTQMDFYDPFLLETLSRAYFSLSQWWQMRLLEEEKRFPDLAGKFSTRRSLAETCLWRGRYAEAMQFLGHGDDLENRIITAKILGKQGRLSKARELLEGAAREAKSPEILRKVAESYYFLDIDAQKGLRLAALALKDKDGAGYYRIHAALLLATGQNDAALREYAKGYKIEFRNRIDQIDPEYMSDYSLAIFLTSKTRYEEIVETLYHLQKDIPACRQIYYAMQGVSAAQARDYDSRRIFRKGG
jgi:tetratricopeptide (TPR) repeat protein